MLIENKYILNLFFLKECNSNEFFPNNTEITSDADTVVVLVFTCRQMMTMLFFDKVKEKITINFQSLSDIAISLRVIEKVF